MELAIIGASALGRQIAHIAKNNGINVTAFFDDTLPINSIVDDIPVLGNINDVDSNKSTFSHLIIGIGYKHFDARESLYERFSPKYKFATIIDKSVIVDPSAKISEGVVIFPGSIIDINVNIEENCFIHIGATIAHDSTVRRHSFLAARTAIAGYSSIGERTFCGINSTIGDNIDIPSDSFISGGAVILNKLSKGGVYMGNPARNITNISNVTIANR